MEFSSPLLTQNLDLLLTPPPPTTSSHWSAPPPTWKKCSAAPVLIDVHYVATISFVYTYVKINYLQQKCTMENIRLDEAETVSFCWKREERIGGQECVASPTYYCLFNGNRWRGLMKRNGVFLQLQSAVNPVTANIR